MAIFESPVKFWYLVYTKTRQEDLARINLQRQGYSVYLPRYRQIRKHQGRSHTVICSLFPRYLFIQLDTQVDNWGPIRSTLGVSNLVRFGALPTPVPESLIAFLRSREDAEGLHPSLEPSYQIGDRIRVAEGPLAGYAGIFLAKSSRERVLVLLDLLGKQVRTQLATGSLELSQ